MAVSEFGDPLGFILGPLAGGLAKANPDKVTVASSGSGGSPHLTAEIFQLATGTKLTHVPYKGGGPAMTDLMAGHVDLLFASVLEGSGHIKAAS